MNTCYYCERPFNETRFKTKDHLIPKSKGGNDTSENLVNCCAHCNHWKDNMLLEEWLDWVEFPLKEDDRIYSFFPSEVIPSIIKNIKKADSFVTANWERLTSKKYVFSLQNKVNKIAKELAWPTITDNQPISQFMKPSPLPQKKPIKELSRIVANIYTPTVKTEPPSIKIYQGGTISVTKPDVYSVFINTRYDGNQWKRDFSFYKGDLSNVDFETDWRFKAVQGKRKTASFLGITETNFPVNDELIMNGWHKISIKECLEYNVN